MRKAVISPEKRKWVRLTRACNNRCLFCLDADSMNGTMAPLSEIEAELRAGLRSGCRRAVLSGGEPAIHPGFFSAIALAKRLGYAHIQAISNGRMFCYDDFLSKAVAAGLTEITFSVHGANPAQHDRLVGSKGAFAQTMRGVRNSMKIPGLIVSSDIVVNGLNVDSLYDIVQMLFRQGVWEYDLLQITPFGRAWKNWELLSYNFSEKKEVFNKVFSFGSVPGVHMWTNRFEPSLLEGYERLIQHPSKLLDEISGRKGMFSDFLLRGVRPPCLGERCRFCVLSGFCADLRELNKLGRLYSAPAPACADSGGRNRKRFISGVNLKKIAGFFVKNRIRVKGAACKNCARGVSCRGGDIYGVMKNGFSFLRPAA